MKEQKPAPGTLWIERMLAQLASERGLTIANVSWSLHYQEDEGELPKPALIFDVNRKRHNVVFDDAEISECGEGYEGARFFVLERLRDELAVIKSSPRVRSSSKP